MIRSGQIVYEQGLLPTKILSPIGELQVITIFVKYIYLPFECGYDLKDMVVFCIPSGELQSEYNLNENRSF